MVRGMYGAPPSPALGGAAHGPSPDKGHLSAGASLAYSSASSTGHGILHLSSDLGEAMNVNENITTPRRSRALVFARYVILVRRLSFQPDVHPSSVWAWLSGDGDSGFRQSCRVVPVLSWTHMGCTL